LPPDKNPIDVLGPLVTDREKFLVNDSWFYYVDPQLPKDTRTSLDDIDAGDIDLDGDMDFIVANRDWYNYSGLRGFSFILRNRGVNTGIFDTFELEVPGHQKNMSTHDTALGDYDQDGDLDLVLANDGLLGDSGAYLGPGSAELFRNLASQTPNPGSVANPASLFEKVINSPVEQSKNIYHAAFVDLNRDGRLDIHLDGGEDWAVTRGIYWNDGGGSFTFTDTPVTHGLYAAAYGDLNLDEWNDMVIVINDSAKVYLSDCNDGGSVTFFESAGAFPETLWFLALGVALGDLDGDGDLDVVVSQGDAGIAIENRIFLNQIIPNP
jgi:hypothetical protein